jgi:hypothetical protein
MSDSPSTYAVTSVVAGTLKAMLVRTGRGGGWVDVADVADGDDAQVWCGGCVAGEACAGGGARSSSPCSRGYRRHR